MPPKKIVILGGGTAGWMAANLLHKRWQHLGIEIQLVESSDIGIIGVGEGSTPQLKSFFDYMNIPEAEWMPVCNASFKTGIQFCDWSVKPGFTNYFHPFPAQPDDYSVPAFFYNSFLRRKGIDLESHPDHFFLSTRLAKNKLAPKPAHHFPFKVSYGYHFDSHLLGQFLKQKAVQAGVVYLDKKIQSVNLTDQGTIKELLADDGAVIQGDFFIDCSGFASVLLQKSLAVPFVSYSSVLFNDSAVVMPSGQTESFAPQTTSTALSSGWMWNIPLTNRIGNGYVYSSAFISSDHAEKELRQSLGLLESETAARHLKMKVGRVEKHWVKNCLAVGLSQGFIEPLEATALHLVQETILGFAESFETGDFTDSQQQKFNHSINKRFDAVKDYIHCHYLVSSRRDSDYWLVNVGNKKVSDSLASLLQVWMRGENLSQEIERQQIGQYYPSASWHCLLAGYGVFPDASQLKPGNEQAHQYDLDSIKDFIGRCALNFPSHQQSLVF